MMWPLVAILVAADQVIKYLAERFLAPAVNTDLIPGVLSFTYLENRGAAFGILQNARVFFIVITVLVLALILIYTAVKKPAGKLYKWGTALVFGGAVGNLIDRVAYGYVIDMIRVHFFDFPVFNFADCCVVAGAVLFCIYILFYAPEGKK